MSKLIDLTGLRFGRLQVLERAGSNTRGKPQWRCECQCGKEIIVSGELLRRGDTRSCGCLKREKTSKRVKEHPIGIKHGQTHTRLYSIWRSMKKRCYVPTHEGYDLYGGRGITVCPEWLHDFPAFRDWALSHGYRDDLSIDRIDNDKGYSQENCRWATAKEQANNRRPRRTLKTE